MALPFDGPISFGDLNDELDNNTNDTLDLIQAGLDFGFSPGAPNLGGNWTDGVAGLSLSEFYGGVGGGVAKNAIYYSADSPYKLLNAGVPGFPATVLVSPQSPFAYGIPAGNHTIDVNVLADGTYYAIASTLIPSPLPASPLSPFQGISGSVSQLNPHTVIVSSLPANMETFSDVGYPINTIPTPYNENRILRGSYNLQDENSLTATVLDVLRVEQLYNNQTLTGYNASGVQTPAGYPNNVIPASGGQIKVWTIDWKFNAPFGISTQAPGNPLPNTDGTFVTIPAGFPLTQTQALADNFVRTEIYATVTQNPSSISTRETWIYAFAPSAGTGTWADEMNKGGNSPLASPSNPTSYYYPIPIIQAAAPAFQNTATVTPNPIPFNYLGDTIPASLVLNPSSNSWSYSKTGPDAPAFTISGLPAPTSGTGPIGFSVSTSAYNGEVTKTATLQFTHPGGTYSVPLTQTGLNLRAFGYVAPTITPTSPVPFNGGTYSTSVQTNAPPNTPWSFTSNQPYVTIPTPAQSGTGPATISYVVSSNPTFTTRPAVVTVDFNVDGTPYAVDRPISQAGQPAVPEISLSPVNSTLTFSGTSPTSGVITVDTNSPFTVNFSGDTPYWNSVNPSQTVFTVPPGSPTPYPFTFTTAGANDDYAYRTAEFTVTSPVAPGTYIKNLVQNRNPTYGYLSFNTPTAAGNWTYTPTPTPQGGRLLTPGATGPATIEITAHPNLPWSISLTQPHPAIPTSVFNTSPIPTTSGTGPKIWNASLPAGHPYDNFTYRVQVTDNAADANVSDEVGLVFGTYTAPMPVPDSFTLPSSQATIPHLGGASSPRTLTSNVPWNTSVSGPLAPALTISPSPSGTGPATISFSAPAVGPTPRSADVTFTNSVGPVVIPVVQEIAPFINIAPGDLYRGTPSGISLVLPVPITGNTPVQLINTSPWISVSPTANVSTPREFDFAILTENTSPSPRPALISVSTTAPQSYDIEIEQAGYVAPSTDPMPSPGIGPGLAPGKGGGFIEE